MGVAYGKTSWIEDVTQTSPANFNNMENGIFLANAPLVSSLPVSPVHGQEIAYIADATAGTIWNLIYNSVTGKWHYKGGAPLYAEVANGGNGVNVGAYADLGTPGPALTFPFAGDYVVSYGFFAYFSNMGNANPVARMAPRIGNVGPD